jgi:hypothetical protein
VNPDATWSVSLESYYPYLQPQEVSKAPTTSCTYTSLPKSAKSRLGCHSPLGVKDFSKIYIFLIKVLNFCFIKVLDKFHTHRMDKGIEQRRVLLPYVMGKIRN